MLYCDSTVDFFDIFIINNDYQHFFCTKTNQANFDQKLSHCHVETNGEKGRLFKEAIANESLQ